MIIKPFGAAKIVKLHEKRLRVEILDRNTDLTLHTLPQINPLKYFCFLTNCTYFVENFTNSSFLQNKELE